MARLPSWMVIEGGVGVHVVPEWDEHRHRTEDTECRCDPDVEWIDQDSGLPYANGPVVLHHCRAGRRSRGD